MNLIHPIAKTQRGVILVVVLVMLVLLTLIGTAGMRASSLQENMASNLRENTVSFQAAESALRTGENEALRLYQIGGLDTLETTNISGQDTSITDTATTPSYDLSLIARIKTSTEAGIPIDDEGMLIEVEGSGAGIARISTNAAITNTTLRSTYLVEK